MKTKLKKITIPFIIMLVFNLGIYYFSIGKNFGGGYSPHVGLLMISGLLLGPYGAVGAVIGNFICDLIRGYGLPLASSSAIAGFGVSYLAYKLWYEKFKNRVKVTKPNLSTTSDVLLFFAIIIVCATLYAFMHEKLIYIFYPRQISNIGRIGLSYFINFFNSSFIFGIIGLWLSKRFDFFNIPKKSDKKINKWLYVILGSLLVISTIVLLIFDLHSKLNTLIVIGELVLILIILYAYLTKPFTNDVSEIPRNSIPGSIMNRFFIMILALAIFGALISADPILIAVVDYYLPFSSEDVPIAMLLIIDAFLVVFFIPSISVLRYVEKRVIHPITSFSQIEKFLHENQKIEAEGLLKIYSEYVKDDDEIGTLSRSYTDLITFNNNYIENISKIEGEKERIKTELDIATRIQASNLPTEAIDNEEYIIDGYSKPAKEVGGDFFDYYELDSENLAIVIGDASGKGVPAALLSTITQVMIKQILKHERDPSRVLYMLNNQLCENNSEAMFITLWVGIYNKNTKIITFSNAGHNPPLIKQDDEYEYAITDTGIVLGIMDDFEFVKEDLKLSEEIILYTDGITDANSEDNEMYGEDRLLKFFNGFKGDEPIEPLLDDISEFTGDAEQFDDMTLVYLKDKT